MRDVIINLMLCVLLGIALLSSARFVRNAPAYNEDLRVQTIDGTERLLLSSSMYDRGAYFFEVAHTYVYGSVKVTSGDPEPLPKIDEIIENSETAEELLLKSLHASPSNGHAWQLLARARSLRAAPLDEVLTPLRISWRLAPNNLQLARQRLELVGTLVDYRGAGGLLSENLTEIATDAEMLRRFSPREIVSLMTLSEGLADLLTKINQLPLTAES